MNSIKPPRGCSICPGIIGLGMTACRIGIAVLCIHPIILQSNNFLVAIMVFLVMLFDVFDGKLFRSSKLNKSGKWRMIRRIIDSCGDRLCIQLVCFPLAVYQHDFLMFYCLICMKELFSGAVCVYSFIKGFIIYPSNVSRLSTFFVGLTVIVYLLGSKVLVFVCSGFLLFGTMVSFISYAKKTFGITRGTLTEGVDYELILTKKVRRDNFTNSVNF